MKQVGIIFNIQRFSIHDGPGIRSTVFLKGCPLNCLWCHNPESKQVQQQLSFQHKNCAGCKVCEKVCTQKVHTFSHNMHHIDFTKCIACGKCIDYCNKKALELIGYAISVDEIIEEVLKDRVYYETSGGGITLSGGEPLLQYEFSLAILKEAKTNHLHTCIETSGFCSQNVLKSIIPYTDMFLFDFKLSDEILHKKYTGVSLQPIIKNLQFLNKNGASVVLRCPIIPEINDFEEHFRMIAELSQMLCISQVELMPYHTLGIEKSRKIGVQYQVESPTANVDMVEVWKEELKRLGCKKLK